MVSAGVGEVVGVVLGTVEVVAVVTVAAAVALQQSALNKDRLLVLQASQHLGARREKVAPANERGV